MFSQDGSRYQVVIVANQLEMLVCGVRTVGKNGVIYIHSKHDGHGCGLLKKGGQEPSVEGPDAILLELTHCLHHTHPE